MLDISGYGFSGKHACIQLIDELQGYKGPDNPRFEFDLLRIQDGIRDLEHAVVRDWSPIRSSVAIRRFRRLIRRLGPGNSLRRPASLFQAVGTHYDRVFNGAFTPLSEAYVNRLVDASWSTDWPYRHVEYGDIELFCRKVLFRCGFHKAYDSTVYLVACTGDAFLEHTRHYLDALVWSAAGPDTTTVVIHNAMEPFNPYPALRYFSDARCIVVDRDPRDSFVDSLGYRTLRLPVEEFIRRYRLYRSITVRFLQDSSRVLRLRFEDLVLDYERTVDRILGFLGEPRSAHARKAQRFRPDESRRNIGKWRQHEPQDDIRLIARELPEHCAAD